MDTTLQELNKKIDILTAQVSYLSEQAQIAERQRRDRSELVRDITPLANQAFNLTIEQLEEIQEYIDLGDLLRLFKRLLRNGRNLEKILDQLESLADLVETVSPLADEAFGKAVDVMSGLESRGYFTFARGGASLVDRLVTSFTEQELISIGDSLPQVISMVKEITQPDAIRFAQGAFSEAKAELAGPLDVSYVGLVRQLRDKDVRRGLALTLHMLHAIGAQASADQQPGR